MTFRHRMSPISNRPAVQNGCHAPKKVQEIAIP